VSKTYNPEAMRRMRLGDLRRLLNHRYGPTLPNDDAGRESLRDMLCLISTGANADIKMPNAIGLWSPWMGKDEAEFLIDDVNRTPIWQRRNSNKELGQRHQVTNAERERLRIWRIAACDMTAEEAPEWRKAKAKARMRKLRQSRGGKSQATSISRTKPWVAAGYKCRRTWERHRKKLANTSVATSFAIKLPKAENRLATTKLAEPHMAVRGEGVPKKEQETESQNEARARQRYA
jgi:hypothetical protein